MTTCRTPRTSSARGDGHVLLFATNPFWRGETIGSWALVLNAITHFDRLERD